MLWIRYPSIGEKKSNFDTNTKFAEGPCFFVSVAKLTCSRGHPRPSLRVGGTPHLSLKSPSIPAKKISPETPLGQIDPWVAVHLSAIWALGLIHISPHSLVVPSASAPPPIGSSTRFRLSCLYMVIAIKVAFNTESRISARRCVLISPLQAQGRRFFFRARGEVVETRRSGQCGFGSGWKVRVERVSSECE